MSDAFDVIVIGAGPAGYPAAIRAGQNKLTVAVRGRVDAMPTAPPPSAALA